MVKLYINKETADVVDLLPLKVDQFSTRTGREIFVEAGEESTRVSGSATRSARSHFDLPSESMALDAPLAADAAADKVRPAVYLDEASGLVRMVYKQIGLRFRRGTRKKTRARILEKFGLNMRRDHKTPANVEIAYDPQRKYIAEGLIDLSNSLMELDEIDFSAPDFVSEFERLAPPTPNKDQWHLRRTAGAPAASSPDIDVRGAWNFTQGSPTTIVALLDDGVEIGHPDLRDNIAQNPDSGNSDDKFGRDYFFSENNSQHYDPRPKTFSGSFNDPRTSDIHGTCCAGVIASAGVLNRTFGAAPDCRILPVKIFNGNEWVREFGTAAAITYAAKCADILCCPWHAPRKNNVELALRAAANGEDGTRRGTRGTPIFAAAGFAAIDKVLYPASSSHTICVGATTDQSVVAGYSPKGRLLGSDQEVVWICAPSHGGVSKIATTDVSVNGRGFNTSTGAAGFHTNQFGGTSSACALAAGVAALVLSMRPNFTVRELKQILADSADKIGSNNTPDSRYDPATGHSLRYGFGKVNAAAAAELADATLVHIG